MYATYFININVMKLAVDLEQINCRWGKKINLFQIYVKPLKFSSLPNNSNIRYFIFNVVII